MKASVRPSFPCFTSSSSPQGKIAMIALLGSAVCYEDEFIVPYLFPSDTVARKEYLTLTLSFTFTSKVMLVTSLASLQYGCTVPTCFSRSVIPIVPHLSAVFSFPLNQTGYFLSNIRLKIFYYCKLKIRFNQTSLLSFLFLLSLCFQKVLRLHNEFLYVDWP